MAKVVIVGAGMSGLTAAAYLSKSGYDVTLIEQSDKLGGLVSSFNYKGFTVDGGIRSTENAGVLFPMLKQLGINDIEFSRSVVSLGVEDDMITIETLNDLNRYKDLLKARFPNEQKAIEDIFKDIHLFMSYLDVLYGINNPLFLDIRKDWKYFITNVIPWLFKFLFKAGKIKKYKAPVKSYLKKYTQNDQLIDLISQHFFQDTPAFFALSYFSIYLDYYYPKGGTGTIVNRLEALITEQGGNILTKTKITAIYPKLKYVKDTNDNDYSYDYLIWAGDQKQLYSLTKTDNLSEAHRSKIKDWQSFLSNKDGGDSVLTSYLFVDLPPNYFKEFATEHVFYTPSSSDLADLTDLINKTKNTTKETLFDTIKTYLKHTTYEISIPALRDPSLAQKGKTALIVSTLMDYKLTKYIKDNGWYDELKLLTETMMVDVLSQTLYPELSSNLIDRFSSTPITINERTGSTDGAITGWAFTNDENPSVNDIPKVAKSIQTKIDFVLQTGQWSYSPAGLPTAIMTGKLAANYVKKHLKLKK